MSVLAFDIETVPDTVAGAKIYDLEGLSDEDVARAMVHVHCQKHGNEFLQRHLHRVVAIAVVFCNGDEFNVQSLGASESDESELIRQFFGGIDKYQPELVSWNGSGFDLPVLHYRALLHGIAAPTYWELGDKHRDFRYNNYISRYHWRHLDLMDKLAGYQPAAFAPLDQVAKMLGFPGKAGFSGAQVADAWRNGEVSAIRDYCETDALNTYLIYLRFRIIRGQLKPQDYDERIQNIRQHLEGLSKPHWNEFLQSWEV